MADMVELVIHKSGSTICAGMHTFPIVDGKVVEADVQKAGSQMMGTLDYYNQMYALAVFAVENNIYDKITDNRAL